MMVQDDLVIHIDRPEVIITIFLLFLSETSTEMATLILLVLLMVVVVKSISIMEMEPLVGIFYLDEGQIFEIPS